jgi:hypothetical protein
MDKYHGDMLVEVKSKKSVKSNWYKKEKVMYEYEVDGVVYTNVEIDKNVEEKYVLKDILENKNVEYLLWRYSDYFLNLDIPPLEQGLKYEHVFFCFEEYEHIVSIFYNNLYKLGDEFSHTVVCCKKNADFIKKMIKGLSVKIVILDYEIVFLNDYNNECLSKSFYDNFQGEYLLFTNAGGIITEKLDIKNLEEYYFCGNLKEETFSENYSLRCKERCLENLDLLPSYKHKNSDYNILMEKLYLEKIPENIFYGSVLRHNSKDLDNFSIIWNSFFTFEDVGNNEAKKEVLLYLEKELGIYF